MSTLLRLRSLSRIPFTRLMSSEPGKIGVKDMKAALGNFLPPEAEAAFAKLEGTSLKPSVPSTPSLSPISTSTSKTQPIPIFVPPAEDPLLLLFTNLLMKHGEKHKARQFVTETLAYLQSVTLSPPLPLLREAVNLVAPSVKVVTMRQRHKNFFAPFPLGDRQRSSTALRWIIKASESRPDRKVEHRLAKEIVAVIRGESSTLAKKESVHKQAVVNRANVNKKP
ncbi:hypothetical protein FRC02_006459 [Tulasnella sp. 418]|nr:hypothetical protein FRC02_006459 [Tulasnella sp. 418]